MLNTFFKMLGCLGDLFVLSALHFIMAYRLQLKVALSMPGQFLMWSYFMSGWRGAHLLLTRLHIGLPLNALLSFVKTFLSPTVACLVLRFQMFCIMMCFVFKLQASILESMRNPAEFCYISISTI